MYMKLSKNVSAKYYQEKKESLQKKQQYESYKNLSDEKKNKIFLSIGKNIIE